MIYNVPTNYIIYSIHYGSKTKRSFSYCNFTSENLIKVNINLS